MTKQLQDYDFLDIDEDSLKDPYAFYTLAREAGPVYQEPHHGVYLVTRYDDIISVARRPEVFSSVIMATGPLTPLRPPKEGESVSDVIDEYRGSGQAMISILTQDPPDHARYRQLVNKLFTPKRLREVESHLDEIAHQLIDEFIDAGEIDFMTAFASPYPFSVIADLLGVPLEDQPDFRREVRDDGEMRIGNPRAAEQGRGMMDQPDAAVSDDGTVNIQVFGRLFEYFDRYIEERKKNPRDDILSKLAVDTFPTGEPVNKEDLLGLVALLFGAGQETTVRMLTNTMQLLIQDPDMQAAMRKEPERLDNYIWESLRYEAPVKGLFRVAREDADIGGVTVPAGAIVMLVWAAGNRDPKQFPNPDVFDPDRREAAQTLAFGQGIHYCPGSPLARFEGKIGFEALLSRMDNIRYAPGFEVEWLPSFIIRGVGSLPIVFDKIK